MDGPIPAVNCDVSSDPGRAFVVAICFLGGRGAFFFFNSVLVAIIAHDSCSNRRVGNHL